MHIRTILSVLVGVLLSSNTSLAQHFTFTANTGVNATVIVPATVNPSIGLTVLEDGDEIGVFTQSGLCVGAAMWQGESTSITVWGDDSQTPQTDGCVVGDTLHYRFWDNTAQQEYECNVAMYRSGSGVWTNNGFYVLSALGVAQDSVIRLNLRALAAGLFNAESGNMRESAFLPNQSPFDTVQQELQDGASTWCRVELLPQDDTSAVSWQYSFLLYNNGRLATVTSFVELHEHAPTPGMYAIRLHVAGHLPVRTKHFHAISPLIPEVDFTNPANIRTGIYSNLDEVVNGVFALVPGNVNADHIINASDRAIVRNSTANVGYSFVDFDGNGIVNAVERVTTRNNLYRYSPL